jgi:hypothetical protein
MSMRSKSNQQIMIKIHANYMCYLNKQNNFKDMKSRHILFIISVIFLFFSCNKDEVETDSPFEFEKSFKINGEYQSDEHQLKFKLIEINDSRCAIDVVCVWEGMVSVKINVEKPVTGTIELNSYNNPIDTLANYSFELLDVQPYPISTQVIDLEDYDVKLRVKKF